jgi:hypothetical protein
MSRDQVHVFSRATALPDVWDATAGSQFFLQRSSLQVLEATNPCGQRYHLAGQNGSSSIAVTYRHKLNLLTFGAGSLNMPVTIVGIPCSVSGSGCALQAESGDELITHIRSNRGTTLILNTDCGSVKGFVSGATLPTCRLALAWAGFDGYFASLRSHYRYRFVKAKSCWSSVKEARVNNQEFSPELYRLYENVYERSRFKLEKLGIEFFRKFPAEIMEFRSDGRPIAFVQTVRNDRELIFMFAGMDYRVSKRYDTYLNILLYLVRKGIAESCSSIDMGQTTEEMKCRLGCRLVRKCMHASHSSRIGTAVLKTVSGLLSYSAKEYDYHVFK